MELYIEYVFFENFLVDGFLLYLSFFLLKRKIYPLRLLLSSALGGAFALVYPLLVLPDFWQNFLKFCVGVLLAIVGSRENGVSRYAINCFCFLLLSAAFAGLLTAFFPSFSYNEKGDFRSSRLPAYLLFFGGVIFAIPLFKSVRAIYRHQKKASFLFDCKIFIGKNSVVARGFSDSGNLARYEGRPVCFLKPKLLLKLIEVGQVWNEMEISTVSGVKKIKVFKAEKLWIYLDGKPNIIENVYLSPSDSLEGREYEILLNAETL